MKRMIRVFGGLFTALVCAAVGKAVARTNFNGEAQQLDDNVQFATGSYTCSATMVCRGDASVTNASPAVPSGMVLIPAGTNSGTDPDFGAYSLTVAAFCMDATEVTKAQWDVVYTWAVANGYGFEHAGSGKASNHPVQRVTWWDCVKWCNARSQKSGRTPCYTVNGQTYKTGYGQPPDCNFAANGYRLPSMTEWEYAARGGLSGLRFPWGNTIDHTLANYNAQHSTNAYDLGYTGFDKRYAMGDYPYTSPAGAFAANAYGLYDMAGNVFEWCNEWEGFGGRVHGGSWFNLAEDARCSSSKWYDSRLARNIRGFRTVCR